MISKAFIPLALALASAALADNNPSQTTTAVPVLGTDKPVPVTDLAVSGSCLNLYTSAMHTDKDGAATLFLKCQQGCADILAKCTGNHSKCVSDADDCKGFISNQNIPAPTYGGASTTTSTTSSANTGIATGSPSMITISGVLGQNKPVEVTDYMIAGSCLDQEQKAAKSDAAKAMSQFETCQKDCATKRSKCDSAPNSNNSKCSNDNIACLGFADLAPSSAPAPTSSTMTAKPAPVSGTSKSTEAPKSATETPKSTTEAPKSTDTPKPTTNDAASNGFAAGFLALAGLAFAL